MSGFLERSLKTRSPDELSKLNDETRAQIQARIEELEDELRRLKDDGGLNPSEEHFRREKEIMAMLASNGEALEALRPVEKREPYKGPIY